ncbi:MAG: ATP-dependent DNA helicase RecQ [Planctomycetota bacterium]|jgi:ATP-dependent DNA helicase RecQ
MTIKDNITVKGSLKQYFGFDKFKGRQEEIINTLMAGKDTIVIMPTGGGKSMCYQLPALMSEGVAIVISPLIALMKNQVDLLRGYASDDSIAHFYNSSLTKTEKEKVLNDVTDLNTKILYIAPETLTKEDTIEFFKSVEVSFVAVDEAHCISEWGHDFRPEYRNIRKMIDAIGDNIPMIALTATATPKVQSDLLKTLKMEEPAIFIDSFNRSNLFYEIRPKKNDTSVMKNIIGFIRNKPGKSGIIYAINRKTTEKIAEMLQINDISAAPYHAGLDSKTRSRTQDDFLMERIDVVVATIAFGMGIDKPDIRYVIHYDLPKSLENYYQETGRAGRDGMGGDCVCYYNYKDVNKLEHLLKDKMVSERLRGMQLIDETVAFIESTICRRKFILHYFGEDYKSNNCGQCDNCKNPKEKIDATEDLKILMEAINLTHQKFDISYIAKFLAGAKSNEIVEYGHNKLQQYGAFEDKDKQYIQGLIRQSIVANYLKKDIEQYGVLKFTEKGNEFLANPTPFQFTKNHDYKEEASNIVTTPKSGHVLDDNLLKQLIDLRKEIASSLNLAPYIIFQESSIQDMATMYPISLKDLENIQGVSKGKAEKYGKEFIELIKYYVEDNKIERIEDLVVRTSKKNSSDKIRIIQYIDKKMPIEDIARNSSKRVPEVLDEIESIINSGTKLDISYCVYDVLDEEIVTDLYEYFKEADTDSLDDAYTEFEDDDLDYEHLQMVRIMFMNEIAN